MAPNERESTLVTSTQFQLPGPGGNEPAEAKTPSEWLLLLFWRQKWVIVAALVLALVGAFVYLRVATPLYTSTARMQVFPTGMPSFTNNQGGQALSNTGTFTNAQLEVIKSHEVLGVAGALLKSNEELAGKVPTRAKALEEVLDAELDRQTDIISVTARHPSPTEAQAITKAVVDAYIKYVSQPKELTSAPALLQGYEKEYDKADEELKKKEQELRGLEAEAGPSIRQDEQNSLEQKRLDELNKQLIATELELKNAERDAAAARQVLERMGATRPTNPVDPLEEELGIVSPQEQQALRLEILQVQAQLQELQERYGEANPRIITLKRRLNRLNTIYLLSIDRREDTLRRQADLLRTQYNEAKAEILRLNSFAYRYAVAKAELEKLRGVRDQYEGQIREIKLQRDTGGVRVEVHEKPLAAEKPSLPEKGKVLVIAVAMGLVLGMVLAALREWLDDRMRSATEIKSSLGMPLLAVIPQSLTKRSFSVSGQRVLLDPASDAAEAYRSLRTAIQFAAPEGLKTLMIASPNSGDGKTTLVSNLGIAWAQAGKKVCIVDCDLRKPTIHDIFSIKTTLGLSTLLAGRSSIDGTVQHTNVSGLDVLPCGPVPANPAEILNSQEFGATLDALADKYDIVLLDSSPVMSASDARVVAASTDATLIVLTAQSAHRRSTETTRDALHSVGARIIGLVVNDVPRRTNNGYGTPKAMRQLVPGLTSQEYDVLQARAK